MNKCTFETVVTKSRSFSKSKHGNVTHTRRDILSAIKVCTSLRDLERGGRVYEFAVRTGFHTDIRVATGLVDMFSKCRSVTDARKVFDSIQLPDAVSWNSLIMGYAENGESETALQLYFRMRRKGIPPTSRTFLSALMACASLAEEEETKLVDGEEIKAGCLEKGMAIHHDVMKYGSDSNVIVSNALVNVFSKCGTLEIARNVFDRMDQRSVVSWTALISGYAEHGQSEMALELYERMKRQADCKPDSRTLVAALTACTNLADKEQANEVNGKFVKAASVDKAFCLHASQPGCVSDVYVATGLVNLYARCGNMEDSRAVFDKMQFHDVVSWNALMHGYAHNGEPELALELFPCMECSADARTYVAVLTACSCLAEKERSAGKGLRKPESLIGESFGSNEKTINKPQVMSNVEEIHSKANKLGFDSQLYVANALISSYASCGSMDSARDVFDTMEQQQRDVISWTALILGYAENGEPQVALKLLSEQMGLEPNPLTFVAGLTACISSADLQSGRKLHAWIYRTGLESNHVQLAASLLEFYAKCGTATTAQHLFDRTDTRVDVATRNALLSAYSRQGDTNRAFQIFNMMREEDVAPNGVTFLGLLTACSHAGLVDVGRKIFGDMPVRFGFIPGLDHYHCMVDMLARGNHLNEALEMIQTMPFVADECTWTIILGACHKWKDVQLGRFAFEKLLEVNSKQPSAYILMGNIYASVGLWEEKSHIMSRLNSLRK